MLRLEITDGCVQVFKACTVADGPIKLIGNTPSPETEITCKTPCYNLTKFANTLSSVI
jgi:hypothetical protein